MSTRHSRFMATTYYEFTEPHYMRMMAAIATLLYRGIHFDVEPVKDPSNEVVLAQRLGVSNDSAYIVRDVLERI